MSNANLTLMFFLQAAAVLLACRAAGSLARRLRQPEAVGHMIAGIALGPSLLGASLPDVQSWLFPTGSRPLLHVVAQVGLVLYMFLVGVEFRLDLFRLKARAAGAIAAAGMIVPLLVGMGIAAWLHGTEPRQFGEGVSRLQAMVFLGAAMSITAFPMMARMIAERGLSTSAVGTLLLAAGAIDDVLAWCVLALLPALVGSGAAAGWWPAAFAFGGGAAFVAVVAVIRPLMKRLHPPAEPGALVLPSPALTAVLTMLALAAWCTDLVGVHSVFGAFVVGAAVPRGWLSEGLLRTLTPVVTALLLPFYFVSSGLSTRVTLIDSWWMWVVAAVIVVGACAGKLLACAAAARLSGEGGRESLAIGAMMNARGLMELMVLNIGLERGVITPALFTVGVVMAVVTTVLATPLFDRFYPRGNPARKDGQSENGKRLAEAKPGRREYAGAAQ